MRKIEEIWNDLENSATGSDRILVRRYSPVIKTDIFVGYKVLVGFKCLAFNIHNEILNIVEFDNNFRDIKIERERNEQDNNKSFLLLTLTDKDLITVFAVLCEDLIEALRDINDESKLLKSLFERVGYWQLLFEKFRGQGLNEFQQRGLYGEIYFLRKLLERKEMTYQDSIRSWVGPKMVPKDFQYSDWGIEVKTTSGKNHQRIKVNNELQLDDSNLRSLFIFHLSLEVHEANGETMPELISNIRLTLQEYPMLKQSFNNSLVRIGYFDEHQQLYADKGYHIRNENVYHVREGFPRLIESQIPNGVGDLVYTIDVGICRNYIIEFEDLINNLTDAR